MHRLCKDDLEFQKSKINDAIQSIIGIPMHKVRLVIYSSGNR